MTGRTLRPYQAEAVQAVLGFWGQNVDGRKNACVVLPTGTGKSTVIAKLAVESHSLGLRVVLLAHRRELLDQMVWNISQVKPGFQDVGFVQAERHAPDEGIVAASFQTLAASPDRLHELGHRDVVLVDEMHHSGAETYMDVLMQLGCINGERGGKPVFTCGFTATATRDDGKLSELWDDIVFERDLEWAINQGFLVPPRGLTVVIPELALESVTVRAGDYAQGELSDVMVSSVDTTVKAVQTHAKGRACIAFAAGVEHANALAQALSREGVPAEAVTGSMSSVLREATYSKFRSGEIDVMVTVQVLTEGADFPRCDCVVMARPTRSQTLYTQMVGRALRLYEGKHDALVLDLAGSTREMSLKTLSDISPNAETKRVSATSDVDPGQQEPQRRERMERIGVANMETIDLLATTAVNWLSTYKGVRFIDIGGKGQMFILPPNPQETDECHVCVIHSPANSMDGVVSGEEPLPLKQAIQFAEHYANAYFELPLKTASWRKRGKPSDAQITFAQRLGIDLPEKKTRARLSDDISIALASRRIDRHVKEFGHGN